TGSSATEPQDNSNHDLATTDGITLQGACLASGPSIGLNSANGDTFYVWGTESSGFAVIARNTSFNGGFGFGGASEVDLDVMAQDVTTGGQVGRIDLHGSSGNPCTFRWVITPAS